MLWVQVEGICMAQSTKERDEFYESIVGEREDERLRSIDTQSEDSIASEVGAGWQPGEGSGKEMVGVWVGVSGSL